MADNENPNVTGNMDRLYRTDLSRRALLRLAAGSAAGLSLSALLAACGGGDSTPTPSGGSGQQGAADSTPTQASDGTPAADETPEPAGEGGGVITVAITAPLQSLDPANHRDRVTETVLRAMFDGLVTRRQDGEIVPEIAESWEQIDDTTWEFKIRSGVTFHNGDPLTAEDVRFSLERVAMDGMMDGETSPRQSLLPPIAEITAPDDQTVRIVLESPVPEAILLSGLVHNQIVPKAYVEEVGGEGLAAKPIGAGPFKFVEGDVSDRIVLERYDDYYGGSPDMPPVGPAKADGVVFRVIPELSSRLASLKAGDVHIVQNLNVDSARSLRTDPNIVVKSYEGTRTTWLAMNVTRPPFDNKLVRQAMNYGLDVQSIIDEVLGGEAVRMTGAVPPFSQFYDDSLQPYPYDPDKAKQLLEEAGVGTNFQFVLDAQEPDRAVAEIIVQQYRQLGLDASVRIWEWPVLQEATLKGERQMLLGSWGNSFRHPVDLINPTLMTGGRGNYSQYSNPELDELLERGAVASKEEAAEIYKRVQQILYEDAPWVFLWVPNEVEAGSAALQNWEPGPDGRELLADTWLAS